ncbi:FtsQ-type POTRA domain-containing protein [Tumebacillus sp. ITR2]|uniref:FtsQ-type POTRA domain-containing protein n=1 Tax=Tumebacillus amylolyticus TaxID=2801339 RepID=A0ABS1JCP8_9BACL|nr:FtsQ-type POTRA domain-containing protein [Tumebacillus amylolyticus]MBL0387995.1 FtsQ-type POTRA domain-containing protein [Tumebacillus amylolyticus]
MHETPSTIAETYTAKTAEPTRKRRPNWKALLFVVVFFVLLLVAGFLQSPLSAVTTIDVKGNHAIRYEEIVRASGITKGMSFWRISETKAADAILKAYPVVQTADIQVSWTGNVVIAVAEKAVSGTLVGQDGFYSILQDGTVLEKTTKPSDSMPLITMENLPPIKAGEVVQDANVQALAKQIPEVERNTLDQISEVRIPAKGPWQVFMRDKFEVRVPELQFAVKMNAYQKFRNSLPADTPPGVLNLLESNYLQEYKSTAKKEGE